MKLVLLSDTHTYHRYMIKRFGNLPDGDVLIHAGDFTGVGEIHEINDFLIWFSKQPQKHKIFIAGNHDLGFEYDYGIVKEMIPKNIVYLENNGVTIEGIKFWGSPITPNFQNWAFGKDEIKRKLYWDLIPNNTDVLITHSPPYGILDRVSIKHSRKKENIGCSILKQKVLKIKPKYHIFGHAHLDYGTKIIDDITFINASICNQNNYVRNKPIVVDI